MKRLSRRQTEILILRQAGLSEREIADALGLRHGRVQAYSAHLRAAGLLPAKGTDAPSASRWHSVNLVREIPRRRAHREGAGS